MLRRLHGKYCGQVNRTIGCRGAWKGGSERLVKALFLLAIWLGRGTSNVVVRKDVILSFGQLHSSYESTQVLSVLDYLNEYLMFCKVFFFFFFFFFHIRGIARSKRDGTRAETRFGLSAQRTSPFKSAGVSVQSTTGIRGVRISGQQLYRP